MSNSNNNNNSNSWGSRFYEKSTNYLKNTCGYLMNFYGDQQPPRPIVKNVITKQFKQRQLADGKNENKLHSVDDYHPNTPSSSVEDEIDLKNQVDSAVVDDYRPNTPSSSVEDEVDLKNRDDLYVIDHEIAAVCHKDSFSESEFGDAAYESFKLTDKIASTMSFFTSSKNCNDGWDHLPFEPMASRFSAANECDFSSEDSGCPKSSAPIVSAEDGAECATAEYSTIDSTASVAERSIIDCTPSNAVATLGEGGQFDYPILVVSGHGTIAVYLRESCIVEMTINKTIRVECRGKFSAATNSSGSSNCILHPDCRVLQQDTRVQCLFAKNKVASFGPQGVMFNMKPMPMAYVVSSTIFKGTTTFPANFIRLPPMDYDFTTTVFYSQSITGPDVMARCQDIVKAANYKYNDDGSLTVVINGTYIRQDRLGNVLVNSRPRMIRFSPLKNTVSVRTHFVDMAVQEDGKAYVKRGVKRVHVSKSGMVVLDGNCITSMDHFGRIVSST